MAAWVPVDSPKMFRRSDEAHSYRSYANKHANDQLSSPLTVVSSRNRRHIRVRAKSFITNAKHKASLTPAGIDVEENSKLEDGSTEKVPAAP